jgi:phosphatidylserine/phosphatidylglycerophosphate/cardiolipin synthase-like enzyme
VAPRSEHIRGRLVDETGAPLAGLVVEATQPRVVGPDATMARGRSGEDGAFELEIVRTLAQELTTMPEVGLVVRDARGVRALHRTGPLAGADRSLDAGTIAIPRADATGWLARGGRVSGGNAARVLADHEGMDRLLEALEGAREKVTILQLFLKPDFALAPDEGVPLMQRLKAIAGRGVQVRILVNDNWLAPDDVASIDRAFADAPNVQASGFLLTPGVLHAKTVVVDDEVAFVVGQPFQRRFWDTRAHVVPDPRRGQTMPNHDLTVEVRGPAVRDVGALFAELWNLQAAAKGTVDQRVAPPAPPPPAGETGMQVTRTLPRQLTAGEPEEGILEAMLRALAMARRFVYVENQYFTNATFVDALHAAVEAAPEVDFLVVLNERPDVPFYPTWQKRRLRALGEHPNLGLFSLWTPGVHQGRRALAPVYVHSKAIVADDDFAIVGSANLDGIGLDGAREFALPDAVSIELNVSLLDGIEGFPRTGAAAQARMALWREHLGLPDEALRDPPPGGWLALWRDVAGRNLRRAQAGDLRMQGMALPLHPDLRPSLKFDLTPG